MAHFGHLILRYTLFTTISSKPLILLTPSLQNLSQSSHGSPFHGYSSGPFSPSSVVPQSSMLGALLFLFFINASILPAQVCFIQMTLNCLPLFHLRWTILFCNPTYIFWSANPTGCAIRLNPQHSFPILLVDYPYDY